MRGDRRAAAGREAGYNMVILVIAVTILNVMLAMALPHWSHLIRRDKEEELRSRGLQYAEAIRVFQMRYGRLPVRLEELIEVKPRSIRRLWTEPMAADGKWGILFQGVPPGAESPEADPANPGLKRVTIGPIVGVHSRSKEAALSTFFGAASYDQWRFSVDLLQRAQTFRPGAQIPRLDLRNLGRPFRRGLEVALAHPGDALVGGGANLAGGSAPGQPFRPGQPGGAQAGRRVPGRTIPPVAGRPGFPAGEVPGRPGTPGGSIPGFPVFPGGTGPGGTGPGGTGPGGQPPGDTTGDDPTQPIHVSSSAFLPPPAR